MRIPTVELEDVDQVLYFLYYKIKMAMIDVTFSDSKIQYADKIGPTGVITL